jgi:hypothetical protein
MKPEPHAMRAEDIAFELDVSVSQAYELMKTMPRVRVGSRGIRVLPSDFQAWLRRATLPPAAWQSSTSASPVGRGGTNSKARGAARGSRTAQPQNSTLQESNAEQPIRHTVPRTKPRSALH